MHFHLNRTRFTSQRKIDKWAIRLWNECEWEASGRDVTQVFISFEKKQAICSSKTAMLYTRPFPTLAKRKQFKMHSTTAPNWAHDIFIWKKSHPKNAENIEICIRTQTAYTETLHTQSLRFFLSTKYKQWIEYFTIALNWILGHRNTRYSPLAIYSINKY